MDKSGQILGDSKGQEAWHVVVHQVKRAAHDSVTGQQSMIFCIHIFLIYRRLYIYGGFLYDSV